MIMKLKNLSDDEKVLIVSLQFTEKQLRGL